MWTMYDRLIDAIPEGHIVEEIISGDSWTLVKAGSLCGVVHTIALDSRPRMFEGELIGMDLKELAKAAKSWNLAEASIGMAAVNAWHNSLENLKRLGVEMNPKQGRLVRISAEIAGTAYDLQVEGEYVYGGEMVRNEDAFDNPPKYMTGKKVCVVGHFPRIEMQMAGKAELSILERDPSMGDYPDTACEYIIPEQDYLFITGMTLTNKTLPRLLQIAGDKVKVSMVGPSATASPVLFDYGANNIAGFVVTDPEYVKTVLSEDDRKIFSGGLMFNYSCGKWE